MAVQNKENVLELIEEHESEIRAMGVKRLGLFGSFVRGESTDESDVDILVEFDQDMKTFDNFIQLSFLLEDVFERFDLTSSKKWNMSRSPLEYLRHVLDEMTYLEQQARGLSKDVFLQDETLKWMSQPQSSIRNHKSQEEVNP